jgi:hypothetical protein
VKGDQTATINVQMVTHTHRGFTHDWSFEMTKEELIKRLETTCFGLDPIDPLRLLVDDVIAALAQPQRTWVGLDEVEIVGCTCECIDVGEFNMSCAIDFARAIEAKLKERNTNGQA